jgi:putative transposase
MQVNRKRPSHYGSERAATAAETAEKRTTDSEHSYPRYPNLVKDLEIVRSDQLWASDITYVRLQQDFVYLAIILDVFTRSFLWDPL